VLSLWFPTDLYEDFFSQNYVSKFARTGVEAVLKQFLEGGGGAVDDFAGSDLAYE